jgi:putative glutamine amidotransferase
VSVTEAYVQAILQAGACPVLIPLGLPIETLDALFSHLDGILFTGGGDIAAAYYTTPDHPRVTEVDPDRDRVEFYLLAKAVQQGAPFLGICRGLQLVNVGLGGTLSADILSERPGALNHAYYPGWPRDHLAHPVELSPGTRLAGILSETLLSVNSLHHQAIDRLALDLTPAAYSPDGLVEAVELPGHPFGLAVQWHPEWLTTHASMRALFRAFVQATERGRET